jgi:hypothetical protein
MLSAFSGSFPLSSRFEDDCSISSYSNQVRITIITQGFENASLGMLVASCASQESDFDVSVFLEELFSFSDSALRDSVFTYL